MTDACTFFCGPNGCNNTAGVFQNNSLSALADCDFINVTADGAQGHLIILGDGSVDHPLPDIVFKAEGIVASTITIGPWDESDHMDPEIYKNVWNDRLSFNALFPHLKLLEGQLSFPDIPGADFSYIGWNPKITVVDMPLLECWRHSWMMDSKMLLELGDKSQFTDTRMGYNSSLDGVFNAHGYFSTHRPREMKNIAVASILGITIKDISGSPAPADLNVPELHYASLRTINKTLSIRNCDDMGDVVFPQLESVGNLELISASVDNFDMPELNTFTDKESGMNFYINTDAGMKHNEDGTFELGGYDWTTQASMTGENIVCNCKDPSSSDFSGCQVICDGPGTGNMGVCPDVVVPADAVKRYFVRDPLYAPTAVPTAPPSLDASRSAGSSGIVLGMSFFGLMLFGAICGGYLYDRSLRNEREARMAERLAQRAKAKKEALERAGGGGAARVEEGNAGNVGSSSPVRSTSTASTSRTNSTSNPMVRISEDHHTL